MAIAQVKGLNILSRPVRLLTEFAEPKTPLANSANERNGHSSNQENLKAGDPREFLELARQFARNSIATDSANDRNQPSSNILAEGDPRRYLKIAGQVVKAHELARKSGTTYLTVTLDEKGEFVLNEYAYGKSVSTDGILSGLTESQFQQPGSEDLAILVRPLSHGYNKQAAETNSFMSKLTPESLTYFMEESDFLKNELRREFPDIFNNDNFAAIVFGNEDLEKRLSEAVIKATIQEHEAAGEQLKAAGIKVKFFDSPPGCPDAVFPNNWAWTVVGQDGKKYLFISSMLDLNRQAERNQQVLEDLIKKFRPDAIVDLSTLEGRDEQSIKEYKLPIDKLTDWQKIRDGLNIMENSNIQTAEGTGVFVYAGRFAIAIRSPRASQKLLEAICKITGHELICVDAFKETKIGDKQNYEAYYHTNVFAASGVNDNGKTVVVMCLESIEDKARREEVKKQLIDGGCEVIAISRDQVAKFGGNIYQLTNKDGKRVWCMSETARKTLTDKQIKQLGGQIVDAHIPLTESIGGGSIRCNLLTTRKINS